MICTKYEYEIYAKWLSITIQTYDQYLPVRFQAHPPNDFTNTITTLCCDMVLFYSVIFRIALILVHNSIHNAKCTKRCQFNILLKASISYCVFVRNAMFTSDRIYMTSTIFVNANRTHVADYIMQNRILLLNRLFVYF